MAESCRFNSSTSCHGFHSMEGDKMNQDRVLEILEEYHQNASKTNITEYLDEYRNQAAQQIREAFFPQGDGEGLLKDEELSACLLTEDEVMEIEQQCTIGLAPDEHIEYEQRYQWLTTKRVQEKTAKRQQLLDNSRHQEEIRSMIEAIENGSVTVDCKCGCWDAFKKRHLEE